MPSPTPAQIGAVVRQIREEREPPMTIEELAGAAGLFWTYVSEIERGKRNPSWRVVAALADALEVSVGDLKKVAETTRV